MILWFWASFPTMMRPHTWMRWRDSHHGARTIISLWTWAKLKSWLWTSGRDSSSPTQFALFCISLYSTKLHCPWSRPDLHFTADYIHFIIVYVTNTNLKSWSVFCYTKPILNHWTEWKMYTDTAKGQIRGKIHKSDKHSLFVLFSFSSFVQLWVLCANGLGK